MLVLAHRGAHEPENPDVRENTLEAFRAASIVDGIELDVRRDADGDLVVVHDGELGDGRPITALARAERPGWLPTLSAALDACDGTVDVELKVSGLDLREALQGHLHRVIVTSFRLDAIDACKAELPGVATGWLTFGAYDQFDALRTVAGAHRMLLPPDASTSAELVTAAHDAGVEVGVWTVNDPDRMQELRDWGADVLITDRPRLAAEVLR